MTIFSIDTEFQDYMFEVDTLCDEELEKSLVEAGGARDKLIVADLPEGRKLIDGHRRYRICDKLGLKYEVELICFQTREQVFEYMDAVQLARRNLHGHQLSIVRGRMQKNRDSGSPTVDEVAKTHGVSERTIYRDAAYAAAVEKLSPEIRAEVVGKCSKSAAIDISKLAPEKQAKALAAQVAAKSKPIVGKTGRESEVWQAQQVMKTWADAVGRWMSGKPSIDEYRDKFPGAAGDRVINAAKEIWTALEAWKKGLK